MSYSAVSIAGVLDRVNADLFLPAIQRPFVWEPEQIVKLFDSLMKGYPISSFLFWDLKNENRTNWEIYRFVENFRIGSTHNEIVEPNGRQITLVLDGQQRLTSLVIGLRGTYTTKRKYKRSENPDAWIRQRLYLNVLKDPELEDDTGEIGVSYGFRFSPDVPKGSLGELWIKVGEVLDYPDEDDFEKFKDELWDRSPDTLTKADQRIFSRNLDRLYRVVWKDEAISYYSEKSQSLDRVLDIFIRANDGGTKLSKSDLLLSMITSKWHSVNAREEITGFVDHLNGELDRKNDFDKDFLMKACLVTCDLDVRYRIDNFTNDNLALIESEWASVRQAVEATVLMINRFGIDRDTLTSANALMPILYYLKRSNAPLNGTTPFEVSNRDRIRRWLLSALLNGAFGGNSDTTIAVTRSLVKEALATAKDFPSAKLAYGLQQKSGRSMLFESQNLESLLDTSYGQRACFLALSLLYEGHNWGAELYHIDHIIPRASFSPGKLRELRLPENRVAEILESGNRLGNLQLLLGRENGEKSNLPFPDWIRTRDPAFLVDHLIPTDPALWSVERLPEFVAEREKLISTKVANLFRFEEPAREEVLTSA